MTVKDFLKISYDPNISGVVLARPLVHCNDGFTVSIQASAGHYSSPRKYTYKYDRVEVGFPSEQTPILTEYIKPREPNKEDADHTNSIFAWVPVDVLEEVIRYHGGIDEERTFKKEEI
jgi:hypothetical protein